MTRTVPEWVGKTPDTQIPQRVRLRVLLAADGKCSDCGRKLGVAGEPVEFDHIIALANGGENRETNLQALCRPCHRAKTNQDVAQKAKDRRVRAKHMGIKETRNPLPGGRKSRWKKKMDGTVVPR